MMSSPQLIDIYNVSHRGETITVQKRTNWRIDYGYKTSGGIVGIGQSSPQQAETDARHAIDRKKMKDEAKDQ